MASPTTTNTETRRSLKSKSSNKSPPVDRRTPRISTIRSPTSTNRLLLRIMRATASRNRAESPVQQRTISIRVPQAAIDSNKFTAQDEPKPRPTPIRASESAEWNGFRVGNNAEVRSNHQDLDQDINRRPSQRVADSIKIREEYLRQREEASRGTESQSSRTRVPGRKVPETTGRGSSRYQDTPYEQGQYADSQNAQPTPLTGEQPRLQVTQSPPFVDEGQKYRADVEEQQKYVQAADRNARIQAQLRALGNRDSVGREAGPDSRRQEELKRKAYEEARARQIDEAEREAREQVRLRQFEEARRKQVEEAERVAKELSERKEREEAQRRAAILEMRRKQVEEAERKANEEARIKAMEEEARRRAEEEALRERQILEARRAKEEAERKQAIEEAQRRAAVEEARRAAIEEARRKAAIEEAERRRAIEEAARRQAIEEAQRRAAVDEARRKAALEEAAREEALKKAKIEEEEEAKRKAADESRRRYLENQRQLEENLSRRRLPARPVEQDTSLTYNSKPSYEATERYKPTSRGSSGFRIVVDSTEPPRGFTVTRPPKKYVSRNSTLINELYLNEQSTTLSNDERTNSVTPNSLLQTSPGRTYTENARVGCSGSSTQSTHRRPFRTFEERGSRTHRVRVGQGSWSSSVRNLYRPSGCSPCTWALCVHYQNRRDLPLEETPQIVLLTFDDSVNDLNKGLYEDLFERGRVNPNGCPISATFYVSHEWTDYGQVQNLYATGHEIASHSVSRGPKNATTPRSAICGTRAECGTCGRVNHVPMSTRGQANLESVTADLLNTWGPKTPPPRCRYLDEAKPEQLQSTCSAHRRLLYAYTNNNSKPGKYLVTYVVAGERPDGEGLDFRLVNETNLARVKSKFSKISSVHVYSVQKGTILSGAEIYNADTSYKLTEDEQRFVKLQFQHVGVLNVGVGDERADMTKKEYVTESCSDDEVAAPAEKKKIVEEQKAETTNKLKPETAKMASPEGRTDAKSTRKSVSKDDEKPASDSNAKGPVKKAGRPAKAKPAESSSSKQSSITSFFKRK
ncbi:unnamed protein product [Nesidiocoris tenuis]|uniref:Uncharacterized protein n=1 Tax=Nesidiocoris tenuis TaxID=355587 RepID=A0A6H5HN36_9HEMI|nr:unnamed protein product [Nesidiocoris tenuis]